MGYLDMEKQTIDTFGGPGGNYLRTGDLGRQDARGFLYICGRIKGKQIKGKLKDHNRSYIDCWFIGRLSWLTSQRSDNVSSQFRRITTTTFSDRLSACVERLANYCGFGTALKSLKVNYKDVIAV
jgi:acyl-CoA synthetase (AMP-forming)/AMP-acid ligase II